MTRMASWGSMKQRGIATPSMGGTRSRGKVGGPSDGKPPKTRAIPAPCGNRVAAPQQVLRCFNDRKMVRRLLLVVLVAGAVLPSAAHGEVKWLCRPGATDTPCQGDQTTTHFAPDGSVTGVDSPPVPADPPVDCFYVYPTVSNQPT